MVGKIIIFGATGGTGVELVKQSIDQGYDVSVFVRKNTDSLKKYIDQVTVYYGDAKDYVSVNKAIVGKDAVLVALGAIPGKKDNILSISTSNIVRSMQENGLKRLIVETGAGLIEDKKMLSSMWRVISLLPPMKIMFDDKRGQEKTVRSSNLDWVIVRPVNLTNDILTNKYQSGQSMKIKLSSKISRADVANFMVKQLASDEWLHKLPTVSN